MCGHPPTVLYSSVREVWPHFLIGRASVTSQHLRFWRVGLPSGYSWNFCRIQARSVDQNRWRSFWSESPITKALRSGHAWWSTGCSLSGCSYPGINPFSSKLALMRRLFKTVSVGSDSGVPWFSEADSWANQHGLSYHGCILKQVWLYSRPTSRTD